VLRIVPVAVVVACACLAAWRDYGSIDAPDWLPYAIVVALVVAAIGLSGAALRPEPLPAAGALALLALAAWVGVSARWSAAPSLARDEALLTALYALALLLPLITIGSAAERLGAAAVVVAGLGALALATELRLRYGSDPGALYVYGRLDFPVSYPNADAAFFLVGFWPAIGLAARRTWPVVARAASLAAATALLAGWLLTQSKGGGIALAVSAVVFFALCPARLRVLPPTLVAAALVGAAFRPLTAPYRASTADLAGSIRHAGAVSLLLVAVAAATGLVYAALDRRIVVSARAHRVLAFVALLALVAALVGGAGAFAATVNRPGHFLADKWRSFKTLPSTREGSSHLFSLGSNRYDFWRVALRTFEHHPVAGVGGRGFAAVYLQEGRSIETPQRAHSLELDELSETGIVGFVLLALGLGLPLGVALVRARRSLPRAALAAAGVYWLVHSTVDWTWSFPALSLPAVVLIGVAATPERGRTLRPLAAVPMGVAALALAVLAFVPPWLSDRYTNLAYGHPAQAASDLRRARRLDPLSTAPYEAEAALARPPANIPPLQAAVRKEPRQVDLRFELGQAYLRAGRKQAAVRELEAALKLDPHSEEVQSALRSARGR
jgi:O-antigen ligase/polysaccharide polymerase Wzy-like membrane protein/tetratricopeptide repeat protein